jgi:hypothetical protein
VLELVSIEKVRTAYYDRYVVHDQSGAHDELVRVEAAYDLTLRTPSRALVAHAEVRHSPHGLQLEWGDDVQDLLRVCGASDSAYRALGTAIVEAHRGRTPVLPMVLVP